MILCTPAPLHVWRLMKYGHPYGPICDGLPTFKRKMFFSHKCVLPFPPTCPIHFPRSLLLVHYFQLLLLSLSLRWHRLGEPQVLMMAYGLISNTTIGTQSCHSFFTSFALSHKKPPFIHRRRFALSILESSKSVPPPLMRAIKAC